jgi:hypothetical protein
MRSRFLRGFIPYQLWRFVVLNFRIVGIARGWIGRPPAPPAAPPNAAGPSAPVEPLPIG